MRTWMRLLLFASPAVWLLSFCGCAPRVTFPPTARMNLEWGEERSFRKGMPPSGGIPQLAFATGMDDAGLAKDGVHRVFKIEKQGVSNQLRITFRTRGLDHGAIIALGYEPRRNPEDAPRLQVGPGSILLVDNRGHRFTIHPLKRSNPWEREFLLDEKEYRRWMEFNHKEYYLTLEVRFIYGGQKMDAIWPKIYCVFRNPPYVFIQ